MCQNSRVLIFRFNGKLTQWQMFLLFYGRMLLPLRGAPTWRFHTMLYKLRWNSFPNIPWSQRFFFFFRWASREAASTSREAARKKNLWLPWTWNFHADARVRIWPSGSDWLIFLQTRKSIWLVRLIRNTEGTVDKHVIADLPLVRFVIINLTRLTAVVCMKVRFKSKVTSGFSISPLRDSCSLIGEKKEKPLGPGYSE